MREDNDSDYKSTCVNEETIDETGSPQERELVYELSTKRVWVVGPGLGQIGPGSTGSDLVWVPLAWTGLADLVSARPVCARDLCAWLGCCMG